MFTGTQEIFVLIIIVIIVFFLPRVLSRNQANRVTQFSISKAFSVLSGKTRLAVIASFIWPLVVAGFLKPWEKDLVTFLYIAIGPVMLGWSIRWVVSGFQKSRKKETSQKS